MKFIFIMICMVTSISANALVIGTTESNNCIPFGCSLVIPGEYQQIYGSSAFSGALDINALTFYNTHSDSGHYDANLGTFSLWLSTTSATVDGLSSTAADNYGGDNTLVYTGALTGVGAFGGSMDILLDTLFNYDPTQGNLLLSVTSTNLASSSNFLFLDSSDASNDQMSRLYGTPSLTSSTGLVTGFNVATSVPAPASIILLSFGIAGLGFRRYRANN